MRVGDRVLTAVIFPLVGPFVGGLWLLCFFSVAQQATGGGPDAIWRVWADFPIIIGVSYVAGFLPAIATVLIYATLPPAYHRVVVGLFVGGIVTWLLWELLQNAFPGDASNPRFTYFAITGAGVAASGVSALVARRLLKLLGREYDHSGGIGGVRKEPTE